MRPDLYLTRRSVLQNAIGSAIAGFALLRSARPAALALPSFPGNGDPPFLVDPAWLKQALTNPAMSVRVLDSSPLRTYKHAHIPGAVHAWWQDTMDQNKEVYGSVIRPGGEQPDGTFDQSPRSQILEDLGIDDQSFVVAYDDDWGRWAAHLVWFLRFLGHDNAAVLEGGLDVWRSASFDVDSGEVKPPGVAPPTIAPRDGYFVETRQFEDLLATAGTALVDVRTLSETKDDLNGSLPLGRIPGAISFPWSEAFADDQGHLLPAADISAKLAALGISLDRAVVLYARFGVEAGHTWLVLKLLGFPNVTIYDWGWAYWASDPANAITPL
ncbi:MAG: sulfurtransferase [Thermomicrobiales bacterium]